VNASASVILSIPMEETLLPRLRRIKIKANIKKREIKKIKWS
jgi:hypothetical protein